MDRQRSIEPGWAVSKEREDLSYGLAALGWLRCTLASHSFLPCKAERPLWHPLGEKEEEEEGEVGLATTLSLLPRSCQCSWCHLWYRLLPLQCSFRAQLPCSTSLHGCCHWPHAHLSCSHHHCCSWPPQVPQPAVLAALSTSGHGERGAQACGRYAVAVGSAQLHHLAAAAHCHSSSRAGRWSAPARHGGSTTAVAAAWSGIVNTVTSRRWRHPSPYRGPHNHAGGPKVCHKGCSASLLQQWAGTSW